MNLSADVEFVDFYYYSTCMNDDQYQRFVEAVLIHMDGKEKREWEISELHRRSKVLN